MTNEVKNEVSSVFQKFYAIRVGDKFPLSVPFINCPFDLFSPFDHHVSHQRPYTIGASQKNLNLYNQNIY